MTDAPEWVTVAQAAALLGVAERQARRVADRLPDSDRRREPNAAGRERLLIRRAAIAPEAGAADDDRTAAGQPTPGMMFAAERVIQEQAARIADLQKALDHEREQTQRLQDALAREQTLRALPAPEANESETRPRRWRWPWEKEPEDK